MLPIRMNIVIFVKNDRLSKNIDDLISSLFLYSQNF